MERLQELIGWINKNSEGLEYGHINISIIKHQGKISKVVKAVIEVDKYDKKNDD